MKSVPPKQVCTKFMVGSEVCLSRGRTGTLRIGSSTQHIETVLANFFPHYRRRHPGVDIDLVEDGGARLLDHLERGNVHLALMTVESDRYHRRLIAPVHAVAIMTKTHRLTRKTALDIKELADDPLLVLSRDFVSRTWFDTAYRVTNIRPRIVLQSTAPRTLIALARTGEGVAIVPSNVRISLQKATSLVKQTLRRGSSLWHSLARGRGVYRINSGITHKNAIKFNHLSNW